MDHRPAENKRCCSDERNVTEIDGTYTCTFCGLVLDLFYINIPKEVKTFGYQNEILYEYCERGNIDSYSQSIAGKMYARYSKMYTSMHKETLIATCIYIACKRNLIPRSMKEISGFTGCTVKRLGQYEKIISTVHYPTAPLHYINRFGCKLNLTFEQIKKVTDAAKESSSTAEMFNPVGIACAYIYKTLTGVTIGIHALEKVSGVPSASIKKLCNKI